MSMKNKIMKILRNEAPLIDIFYYIQGHLRFKLYYSKFKWLIRRHIREQIAFRIRVMDPICFSQGSCRICGCETTMLQMANKPCEGYCYPEMFTKEKWNRVKYIINDYYKTRNDV